MFTSSANVAAGAALVCLALANGARCAPRTANRKWHVTGSRTETGTGVDDIVSNTALLTDDVLLVKYENSTETAEKACSRANVDGVVLEPYQSKDQAELARMHGHLWTYAPPETGKFPGATRNAGPHPEFAEYAQCRIVSKTWEKPIKPGKQEGTIELPIAKPPTSVKPPGSSVKPPPGSVMPPIHVKPPGGGPVKPPGFVVPPSGPVKPPGYVKPPSGPVKPPGYVKPPFGSEPDDEFSLDFENVPLMPGQSADVNEFYSYLTTSANGSLRCCSCENTGPFPKATKELGNHLHFEITQTDPQAVIQIDESVAARAMLEYVNVSFVHFVVGDVVTISATKDKSAYSEEVTITKDMVHKVDECAPVFNWVLKVPQLGIQTISVAVDIDGTNKTASRGVAFTCLGLELNAAAPEPKSSRLVRTHF